MGVMQLSGSHQYDSCLAVVKKAESNCHESVKIVIYCASYGTKSHFSLAFCIKLIIIGIKILQYQSLNSTICLDREKKLLHLVCILSTILYNDYCYFHNLFCIMHQCTITNIKILSRIELYFVIFAFLFLSVPFFISYLETQNRPAFVIMNPISANSFLP